MKDKMKNWQLVFCSLLITAVASAQDAPLVLRCEHPNGRDTQQIKQAPSGQVQRIAPHKLQLRWAGGVKTWQDKPPYDDPLDDGEVFLYCGTHQPSGLHLIASSGGGLFSGVLFDAQTGKTLPAGLQVTLSPDTSRYFASEQPSGLDGEQWHVYSRSGQKLWSGYSFLSNAQGQMIATLEAPRWVSNKVLTAQLSCISPAAQSKTQQIFLQEQGKSWTWQPKIQCPIPR